MKNEAKQNLSVGDHVFKVRNMRQRCYSPAGFVQLELLLLLAGAALLFQMFPQVWSLLLGLIRIWEWPQWGFFLGTVLGLMALLAVRYGMNLELTLVGRIRRREYLSKESSGKSQPEPRESESEEEESEEASGWAARLASIEFETLERIFGLIRLLFIAWFGVALIDLFFANFSSVAWMTDLRNWSQSTWFALTCLCLAVLAGIRFAPDLRESWQERLVASAHRQHEVEEKKKGEERRQRSKELREREHKKIRRY